jgi:ABC-2 type transport system ATP-binding protein
MIKLSGLKFSYGGDFSLEVDTLEFGQGITGLLGRNGSGKTTLLNIANGLLRIEGGHVLFNNLSFWEHRNYEEIKRNLGYLPAENFFFEDLSVIDNWELVGYMKHRNRKIYKKNLDSAEQLGVNEHLRKPFKECSTGTRRKVEILASLFGDPQYLILDEPHNGLDIFSIKLLNDFLKARYSGSEKTLILSSHIVEIVEKMASDVVVIDRGRIVGKSPVKQVANLENYYFSAIESLRS